MDQWQFLTIEDGLRVFDECAATLITSCGYNPRELNRLRLVYKEAIVNAVRHGNQNDPKKVVTVSLTCTASRVEIRVEDQGPGFDPTMVPDPRAPENRECPTGRGLLLMRSFMTDFIAEKTGNGMRIILRFEKNSGTRMRLTITLNSLFKSSAFF